MRCIPEPNGTVAHIFDLARKMSQAISESKCDSVRKGALSMIGRYAKTYIISLHDDERKYCPNTNGTHVHIVPQKSVQKVQLKYEIHTMDMPIDVDQIEDEIIIPKEEHLFPSYIFCIPENSFIMQNTPFMTKIQMQYTTIFLSKV